MLNEVIIMGRLTADPVLQSTDKGVPYCKFILANEGEFFKEGFKAACMIVVPVGNGDVRNL